MTWEVIVPRAWLRQRGAHMVAAEEHMIDPTARTPIHPFDADTRVAAVAEHTWAATITDRWNTVGGRAFGGYSLAVCLQALRLELPLPDPLTAAALFLGPVRPGPATVSTEVARIGRRVAAGHARLVQSGVEVVHAMATFTDLRSATGRTLIRSRMPDLPPPGQAVELRTSIAGVTVTDRIEYRLAQPPGWSNGRPSGAPSMTLWLRFRQPRDPDLLALAMLVDAAPPAVFEVGETGSTTIELTVHLRAHPAPGWLACKATTRHVIGGYHEEDFEIWDSHGKLVAQSRQLALLPATAHELRRDAPSSHEHGEHGRRGGTAPSGAVHRSVRSRHAAAWLA